MYCNNLRRSNNFPLPAVARKNTKKSELGRGRSAEVQEPQSEQDLAKLDVDEF
ncbi:hypothetical protein ETAA8_18840 [Anatilimnocola aggregata]|uniref:Uncharacterized protein n=1 Tax=Anatilimnocola aggregata TaxID=2528021 RepID=A0A517Y9C8_9BACT|nr:hypothetical protein ETAA8_18840 [Anatilimnocola aggregata]